MHLRGAVAAIASIHEISGRGARLLLDADLPDTGGLSSSAALVVGALRTLSDVWELDIASDRLPELALRAEHALGLENGGMDQTVVAVASAGHALWIGFDPLRWRHVPIPDGLEIIAASSGQTAHKGAGANVAYNSIVASCRAATLVIARRLGIEVDGPIVLRAVADHPDVDAAVAELPNSSTPADVARALGIATDQIVQLTAKRLPDDLPIDLRNRAAHVLSETRRVAEAEAAMSGGDVETLGRLLDLSHESLQRFGVSSGALDHLTGAMRAAGALGARVTGAGFGGFAVAVTRPERTAAVLEAALTATGGPAFRVDRVGRCRTLAQLVVVSRRRPRLTASDPASRRARSLDRFQRIA